MSSITTTNPGFALRGPSELTVTAARTRRPAAATSISRDAAPNRSERRINCNTTREASSRHPGFPIKLVDTVGAGDAFTAGLVHSYLRGASLAQMAEIGNLCGSYVAGQPGATPPLSAELSNRIDALLNGGQSL